ncbi:MAG: hypothetical protein H0T89_21610, partial [Deltaproteobacteria bacterium]|nr:hypothetical protein [Deltaproteobacteria bacterium]
MGSAAHGGKTSIRPAPQHSLVRSISGRVQSAAMDDEGFLSSFERAGDLIRAIPERCDEADWAGARAAAQQAAEALRQAVREDPENDGLLDDPWSALATAALERGRLDVPREALGLAPIEPAWIRGQLVAALAALEASDARLAAVLLEIVIQSRHDLYSLISALIARVGDDLRSLEDPAAHDAARYLATPTHERADTEEEREVARALARWGEEVLVRDDGAPLRAGLAVVSVNRAAALHAWAAHDRGVYAERIFAIAYPAYLRAAREEDAERVLCAHPRL